MAIQYVGGRGAGRAGSTSTVNVAINSGLSGGIGSAAIAGDLVVVTVAVGTQGRNPSCAVSGYTAKTQQHTTSTTYDISVCTSYKIIAADTSVTIPSTGNIADGQGYEIHVFRGVDPSQVEDVAATYAASQGVNNRPDPAAIQPITAGAWIYCGGGGAASTGTTVFTASYLSGFLSHNGPDTNDGTAGAGYYSGWSSGSYNPAVWAGGSVNAANSWGATTLALRPGAVDHSLTATGITAAPVLAAPVLSQNHTLVAPTGLAATPGLGGPLLSQVHSLTATGIAGGSPTTGTPIITVFENYSLTANGIAGGIPAIGTSAISQVHTLTGDGQTVAPETGSPTVTQNQVLAGDGMASGAPALGGPAVSQAHLLTADVMAASAPALGEPLVAQLHQMIAEDLSAGTPAPGTPTIGGASHELTADGLTFGAELDETTLAQIHALVVNGIIAGPETGEPGLSQIHSLLAHEIIGGVLLSESYIVVPPPPGPSRTFVRLRRSMVRQTRRAVTRNKLRMVR